MLTKKVGTMKPGWSQHPKVPRGMHPFGLPDTSHPGTPAHAAFGFPHAMQMLCSQVGKLSAAATVKRSEEHTSELQSPCNLVCRLLLEKKKNQKTQRTALRL